LCLFKRALKDYDHQNNQFSPMMNIKFLPDKSELNTNALIKLEAPSKDHRIEEVNVTMVVKDEKSNVSQKYGGNWKPEASIVKQDSIKNNA
jgi:hypothetical protein